MRTLYWVPTIHIDSYRAKKHRDHPDIDFANRYVAEIKKRIEDYNINRVYLERWQGHVRYFIPLIEDEIISDLVSRGAILERTEDNRLVEYFRSRFRNKESLKKETNLDLEDKEFGYIRNLIPRDITIRNRVKNTLEDGENGLLLIGAGHVILDYGDITIVEVYNRQLLIQENFGVNELGFGRAYQQLVDRGFLDNLEKEIKNLGLV